MKVGVVYPQIELGGSAEAVRSFAKAAEAFGYDYISAYDHVLVGPHDERDPPLVGGGYTEKHPFHDPFMMFSHLAAITPKLEFVSGVLVLPQRQAILVARQAADLDLFSGGRLRLGVGTGWNYLEYQALGMDFPTRGPRLDEQIDVMRRLWSGGVQSFNGRYHRVDRMALNPPPTRQIPIWMGGRSEIAYQRAARTGDGFIFAGRPERAREAWTRIYDLLVEAGRDPAHFGRQLDLWAQPTPMEMRDLALRWQEAGGTHVGVGTVNRGLATLAEHIAYIAEAKQLIDNEGLQTG